MKVKALTRPTAAHQAPGSSVTRQPRNLDPALHPFERAREYTRALNATKLDRMFASPFIAQLGKGHVDGVYTMAKDPQSLERFASGSGDGVVKVWDLTSREEIFNTQAHEVPSASHIPRTHCLHLPNPPPLTSPLRRLFQRNHSLRPKPHLHHPSPNPPLAHLNRHHNSRHSQSNRNLHPRLLRQRPLPHPLRPPDLLPLFKTTLALASNALCWNPMEAFNLAVANEDHNIYIFDVRKMSRALNVLKDHVAAVMDVSFSPTGEELVSASYDRTIRLWNRAGGHSRDIYHTKRMQRVFSACFTPDSNYILSGSDDGNVRLWRAKANARSGIKSARQRQKLEYDDALKERYKHMPEIRRIMRHRRLPKQVKKAGEIKGEEVKALKRRVENERKHSRKGEVKRRPEREKMVLRTEV
ncbi:protein SOF1 [Physcia stellaris]|nr:protein SOF1 [Physcia stellaris]